MLPRNAVKHTTITISYPRFNRATWIIFLPPHPPTRIVFTCVDRAHSAVVVCVWNQKTWLNWTFSLILCCQLCSTLESILYCFWEFPKYFSICRDWLQLLLLHDMLCMSGMLHIRYYIFLFGKEIVRCECEFLGWGGRFLLGETTGLEMNRLCSLVEWLWDEGATYGWRKRT